MLREPTHYEILQEGHTGDRQNGYSVTSIGFHNFQQYEGWVSFTFPDEKEGGKLRVELFDSQENLLFSADSRQQDGTWNEDWYLREKSEYAEENEKGEKVPVIYPAEYTVTASIIGVRVPVGETVTAKIIDLETGQTVCTDTRTLNSVQY